MSDRGRGGRQQRGAGAGNRQRGGRRPEREDRAKRTEPILDLSKYLDKSIYVKFAGGREVIGMLKGYDTLLNIVLDHCKETLKDDEGNPLDVQRNLGLTVCRGTSILMVAPAEGLEEISNPFEKAE